jgi:hypothetical protein
MISIVFRFFGRPCIQGVPKKPKTIEINVLLEFECLSTLLNPHVHQSLPWFQRFIFIIFIAKGRGKINLWLKAAIDSSSRANQFELGSDPDSVS